MPPSDLNIRRRNLSLRVNLIGKKLRSGRAFTEQDVDDVDEKMNELLDEWNEVKGDILNVLRKEKL